jgi:DNA-binding transcriptional LysR family regulator
VLALAAGQGEFPLLEGRFRLGELDRRLAAAGVRELNLSRRSLDHFYSAYEAALVGERIIIVPTLIANEGIRAGRIMAEQPQVRISGMLHVLVVPATKTQEKSIQDRAFWLRAAAARVALEVQHYSCIYKQSLTDCLQRVGWALGY